MSQTHIKWIRQALNKARPKEIMISWDGYYPMCPRCGSWEAERHRGEIWPYCPMCGQKIKGCQNQEGGSAAGKMEKYHHGEIKRRE